MIQFYFFSVFLNIVGGYSLCSDVAAVRGTAFDGVRAFLRDRTARLVIGILAAVTGAFKFLTVLHGDIPVVGDFLPALAGVAVGSALVLDHVATGRAEAGVVAGEAVAGEVPSGRRKAVRGRAERFLLDNQETLGIAGIIAGVVHLFFPMVMFL